MKNEDVLKFIKMVIERQTNVYNNYHVVDFLREISDYIRIYECDKNRKMSEELGRFFIELLLENNYKNHEKLDYYLKNINEFLEKTNVHLSPKLDNIIKIEIGND